MKVLEPGVEGDAAVRGSAAMALGNLGQKREAADETVARIQSALSHLKDPDRGVRDSATFALNRLLRYHHPKENDAADELHQRGMDAFGRASVSPGRLALIDRIRDALEVLGKEHGIEPSSKKYQEKDYQTFLRTILVSKTFQVLSEAETAGRDRTDLIVQWGHERALLELKLKGNKTREDQLLQVQRYLEDLENHQGILVVLNKDETSPGDQLRQERVKDIEVFELWMNRPHASQLVAPKT